MNRLRELAERPLGPSTARAVLVLGCAVSLGLGVLVVAGILSHGRATDPRPPRLPVAGGAAVMPSVPPGSGSRRRRDRLDEPGSPAQERAGRELATHRALQHLPWRHDGVSVSLVGARGGRAVLEVRAADPAAGRHGYEALLARYHDDGSAYVVRLRSSRVKGSGR